MSTQIKKQYIQALGHENYLLANNGVLTLQKKNGPVIDIFSADVVEPIRHMITQAIYKDEFPKRLSVVSALQGRRGNLHHPSHRRVAGS